MLLLFNRQGLSVAGKSLIAPIFFMSSVNKVGLYFDLIPDTVYNGKKSIGNGGNNKMRLGLNAVPAHRTPEAARNFALTAREAGFGAIIAAAGKAAHLAGALAAASTLPVIGIPVKSSTLDGLDALLSTVQMPSGIPVATVAIDGAQNAALLAAQMLAIYDGELAARLDELRREMEAVTLEKDRALREKLEKERN